MTLTRKAIVYLALAYAFIGLTVSFQKPELTVFIIILAVTLFHSTISSHRLKTELRIRRRLIPPRSFGGESIHVTLQIRNESQLGVGDLRITDSLPKPLRLEAGALDLNVSLSPGEQIEHTYRVSAPKRGRYILGPLEVQSTDLLGLRRFSLTIPLLDQVLILPSVEDIGPVELRAKRVGPWPGTIPSRSVGQGTEFYELRPYIPGEELRRINWKASAKRARLISNDFESEKVTDVLLILDCSEAIRSEFFSFGAEELQVSLAASLCSQLLLQGNRVGLLVYGAERTWVAPAFGKRQLLKILSGLAIAKAGRTLVPIGYAVQTIVAAVLPVRSVIVFISPLTGDEIVDVIRVVAGAGYSVVCFTPSVENNTESQRESDITILARRIFSIERTLNIRRISGFAKVLQVSPRTPIRTLLRRGTLWKRS